MHIIVQTDFKTLPASNTIKQSNKENNTKHWLITKLLLFKCQRDLVYKYQNRGTLVLAYIIFSRKINISARGAK